MLDAETARSVAELGAGQLQMDPYSTLAQVQQEDKKEAWTLLEACLFSAAGKAGGFGGLFSDERLKKDIKKLK